MLHYSNKKIDAQFSPISLNIEEGQLFKLPKKDSLTENHIYFVSNKHDTFFKKLIEAKTSKNVKDYSFLLEMKEDLSHIFISEEMKEAYRNGALQDDILKMRRNLIAEHERAFTEPLGFNYIHYDDGEDFDVPF